MPCAGRTGKLIRFHSFFGLDKNNYCNKSSGEQNERFKRIFKFSVLSSNYALVKRCRLSVLLIKKLLLIHFIDHFVNFVNYLNVNNFRGSKRH